jgi:Flp pilus assembly protein TadG
VTRRARSGRAQSLVEFALVAPLFFGVVLLTLESGRLMIVWSLLAEASREATRTAVLPGTTTTSPVVSSALQLTAWFGTTSADVSVLKNGAPVSGAFSKQRGDTVSVRIVYHYTAVIARPLGQLWPGKPPAIDIPVQTQMRAEG